MEGCENDIRNMNLIYSQYYKEIIKSDIDYTCLLKKATLIYNLQKKVDKLLYDLYKTKRRNPSLLRLLVNYELYIKMRKSEKIKKIMESMNDLSKSHSE